MFKVIFNELATSIEQFVLSEKERPVFENVNKEMTYYKSVVDEFYYLENTLKNIMDKLDKNKFHDLYLSMDESLTSLHNAMEKYKTEFIVQTYIKEHENFTKQTTLFQRIYKFEQSLISKPLIKIDTEAIEDVLVCANEFVISADKFYFFANNPFEIDDEYKVVIPKKYEYKESDKFITGLYNYLNEILNTYKHVNADELASMNKLENIIKEKLIEFSENLRVANNNKYKAEPNITPEEYLKKVEKILDNIKPFITELINLGIYRFHSLSKQFKELELEFTKIKNFYYKNPLYVESKINETYQIKLQELQDMVILLEDGKINISEDYIETDTSLKELVETIIKMARKYKKSIYYTEKYYKTGLSKELKFEFYQTSLFLKSIKAYYYELMTQQIYRENSITIYDYGDGTIDKYREKYITDLNKYEMFISQEVYFMNEFEITEYITKIENMQELLKKTAMIFFDSALKTSPLTFVETIENHYKIFLDKLKDDLKTIKSKNVDIIKLNADKNRVEALTNLRTLKTHIESIEHIINISKKYVFLDMTDFIENKLFNKYDEFYLKLKESFDKEEYIKVIDDYKNFYKTTKFDFNMLNSLEKLAKSVEIVFERITSISAIFIDEQVSNNPVSRDNIDLVYMQDLFVDERYKVLRNELFSHLDNFYEFVISVRKNEKPFLMNERNLKKIYFDNQLVKINYIRLYDMITYINLKKEKFDNEKLETFDWYKSEKHYIQTFDYIKKLNTLIFNQNRILAKISKMIKENNIDTTNITIDTTSELILSIDDYNKLTIDKIVEYDERLDKINNMLEYELLVDRKKELLDKHTESWVTLINGNDIKSPDKVSYNAMETFKGNIPFLAEFEAKVDSTTVGDKLTDLPTFTWYFGEEVKIGNKVAYTFYKEGLQTVRCEMSYKNGETSTRFIKFDISGPTNSQIVKSDKITYSPIKDIVKQPKLTYFDEKQNKQITVPINVSGNVLDMVKDGDIVVSESDQDLIVDKIGLVVLGFTGVEFAGEKFDQKQIFQDDFELPTEAEFLFDFKVSDPIINKSVININDSKFIEYMVKVPKERASSPYEIVDASDFQVTKIKTMPIIEGDMIIMKNTKGRYMVLEISGINEITNSEKEEFYFEMDFNYHVNISLKKNDKTTFKPLTTKLVVPKIMFKTNVQELFGTLISRLEKLNSLKDSLKLSHDIESKAIIQHKIDLLEEENSKFYLFEEYNKLNAKINSFSIALNNMSNFKVDYKENNSNEIANKNALFLSALNSTKSFSGYMNDINVYEFRKNIIDLEVLLNLYKEQRDTMNILIDTYNFKEFDISYFVGKIKKLKFLPTNNISEYSNGSYIEQILLVVNNMREHLFKLKLIINFPIMAKGKYIIMDTKFERLFFDSINKEYRKVSEEDFYLLNKKLELEYGFEVSKVQEGAMYVPFITEITDLIKSTFGPGLSSENIGKLSNYIQTVEDRVIDEYDDFFLISFWIDYLEKAK